MENSVYKLCYTIRAHQKDPRKGVFLCTAIDNFTQLVKMATATRSPVAILKKKFYNE